MSDIYDEQDFTSARALKIARLKWRELMGRHTMEGDKPIHRWLDASAFHTPLLFQLLTIDPELKIVIMIRHPEDFTRSCHALLHGSFTGIDGKKGFIWDRQEHPRWKQNYAQYWLECHQAIRKQLRWLQVEPDLVMFMDAYGEGRYIRQLLRLWDIPETEDNIEQANWFCSKRALHAASNREAWSEIEIPDLEFCKSEWDWWKESYAWMVEKERS